MLKATGQESSNAADEWGFLKEFLGLRGAHCQPDGVACDSSSPAEETGATNWLRWPSPNLLNAAGDAVVVPEGDQDLPHKDGENTSAFRSVVPEGGVSELPPAAVPTSAESQRRVSLLRDLLVQGKAGGPVLPPRVPLIQHDQGRLGSLPRNGEMERWSEVVQYLGLPTPHHHTQGPPPHMATHVPHPHAHLHHPQALYPETGLSVPRGVLLNNATLAQPMTDPMTHHNITYANSMGASSHLVTSSMNLTSPDLAGAEQHYKMDTNSSMPPEMMYYQNNSAEMSQQDGLLSSILNDEALGLMEMAMNDYSSNRSQVEYSVGGSPYRYGGVPTEDRGGPPPPVVAQKKHQMFGKRYFHDNLTQHGSNGSIPPTGDVGGGGYNSPYHPHPPMDGNSSLDPLEMKFSCTMDFRSQTDIGASTSLDHIQHNHTYHQIAAEGPSGLGRQPIRDKSRSRRSENDRALSRDEKRARALNLPMDCSEIINLPMDEFNERISKYDLTEAQLSLIRDIRRRGKNKVAAQNCRKRKLDQIVHLAEEVKTIQTRKTDLVSEHEYLTGERLRMKHRFSLLYRHIFQSLRGPDGLPYSPHEYSLQQSADGTVLLVPRSTSMDSAPKYPHHQGRPKDDQHLH